MQSKTLKFLHTFYFTCNHRFAAKYGYNQQKHLSKIKTYLLFLKTNFHIYSMINLA